MAVLMNKKDEMIMRLVHYFITEENYSPIVVNGVKDEIWLQNQDGPYKIIRINANYIHNKEQYEFDIDHNHYVFLPCPLPLEEIINLLSKFSLYMSTAVI